MASYEMTRCADPWDGARGDDEADRVKAWLEGLGIVVLHFEILPNGRGQACEACNCLSGQTLLVITDERGLRTLLRFGFVPVNG